MKSYLTTLKVLTTLTQTVVPDLDVMKVCGAAISYYTNMQEKIKHEGKKKTAEYYKTLHLCAISLVTKQSLPSIAFCKVNRRGIPKDLNKVYWLLSSDNARLIRLGLTITRLYETIYILPEWKPEPITSPGTVLESTFLHKFNEFAELWTSKIGARNLKGRSPETLMGHATKGPNGPSIITSHLDARAVLEDKTLFSALSKLASLTGNSHLLRHMERMSLHAPADSYKHGRISLLSEGGAKTRTIAIADFWSQNILRGIHNDIMYTLKKLKTDGTWNQNAQVERIMLECKADAHSFDLSSATDRFPIKLQTIVMAHIFNKNLAEAWETVMTQRSFHIRDTTVRWTVGQPLGLLSSWAAFSITHHCLIEYCAYQVGIKSFRDYAVLGDDVVIWNRQVASIYERLTQQIGVSINLSKSLISDQQNNRIEFAKRILFNGSEVTGLKPTLMIAAAEQISLLPALILETRNKHWDLPWTQYVVPAKTSTKRLNLTAALLLDSIGEVPQSILERVTPSSRSLSLDQLRNRVLKLRVDLIKEKQSRVDNLLAKLTSSAAQLFARFGTPYCEKSMSTRWDPLNLHPLEWILNHQGEQLALLLSMTDMPLTDENPYGGYSEIAYIPAIGPELYFGDRKELQIQFRSNLVMKAWDELTLEATQVTLDKPQ